MAEDGGGVGSFVERCCAAALAASPVLESCGGERPARTAPLDIVIPVFNNAAMVSRCLGALLPTLGEGDTVWLIDDASEEPAIPGILEGFGESWGDTRHITLDKNLGFVGASNHAFNLTRRDVVLLNSDTEPGSGWLEQMQATLDRNPGAGIVCPVSNRATLLSVCPDPGPDRWSEVAAAAEMTSIGDVALPTAVGFCMLIRRRLLEAIGPFSQAFSPGYGEENDLSMRALAAGWDIVAADRACVYHHSGGSFAPDAARELKAAHQERLDRIWPEYAPLVRSWWRDNPLRAKAETLAFPNHDRPAIVHVLHRQYHVGGTERVVRSLIRQLDTEWRQWLVYPGRTHGPWCDLEVRNRNGSRELMMNHRWIRPTTRIGGHGADFTCPQSERALARIITGSKAQIVHFHHMLHWDSLILPALARRLGCRVVVSVHDFWFNCPIHNQLEHRTGQPCGRTRAQADARCGECLAGYGLEPGRMEAFATSRHTLVEAMLAAADRVIVPSTFIREKLLSAFRLPPDRVTLLPHGVFVPERRDAGQSRTPRLVAYLGGDQVLKGAGLVLEMARACRNESMTFRIHGRIKGFDPDRVPPNVELRGFYNPDDVGDVLQDVDLAVLPSHYEESFSLVASECWAHGVPVLASCRGALAERVKPGINGWLVPDMQPESWIQALQSVLEGDTLEICRERLAREPVVSIQASARAHQDVYTDLLHLPVPPPDREPRPARAPVRFLEAVASLRDRHAGCEPHPGHSLGIIRDHWGTAYYRVRFPLEDLARSADGIRSGFHVIRESGFDIGPALEDTAARHIAVQPFLSDEGLRMMEHLHRIAGLHVTLVVDDLWTDLHADNPARAKMPDDVPGRLAYAASLCQSLVLTTEELRRRLGLDHENTHVIDNALPEWVWEGLPIPRKERDERPRIGWTGAPQHGADLAFLPPVLEATRDLADWVFLGMCPEALRALGAEQHAMLPFKDYPATLAGLGLDLAIAPLTDHAFNRCKSHLKVLECGMLGIPVIAADLEPYRHCPVPLAEPDDVEDWTSKIRRLLCHADERRERGRALRQWVTGHHLTQHRRRDWAAALDIG